jgi:hypothetical protein
MKKLAETTPALVDQAKSLKVATDCNRVVLDLKRAF